MMNDYLQYGMPFGTMGYPPVDIWKGLKDLAMSLFPSRGKSNNQNIKEYHPEYFEDANYMFIDDVEQITTFEALYLPIGEVMMVRSENVPTMSDHFAIISGPIEIKEHGTRPQTISIAVSPHGICMLDLFEPKNGTTLLRLSPQMRDAFHLYHGAKVEGREIHCLISKTA